MNKAIEKKSVLRNPTVRAMGFAVFSIVVALLIGAVILLILGFDPLRAYGLMLGKAFRDFDQVLRRATPLIFTALAVAVPLQSGMFNIGEGQLVAGAFAAAVLGSEIRLPIVLHVLFILFVVCLIGAALGIIPAIMKLKFNAPELVVAIMLNTVIVKFVEYLTLFVFHGDSPSPQTNQVLPSAMIPKLFQNAQWSWSLIIGIVVCFLVKFVMEKTTFGIEMKSAGLNRTTSKFLGINVRTMSLIGMAIGGALAAMGGAVDILGGKYSYFAGFYENYGFDGIAIAYMANADPILIIFMAIVISIFKIGVLTLERSMNISAYFNTALQGIIIVMLVCPYICQKAIDVIRVPFQRGRAVK